jgi:hypothetical protein
MTIIGGAGKRNTISCAKKILLLYGALTLAVAFFAVPVQRTTIREPIYTVGHYGVKTITERFEYTDLTAYLSARKSPVTVGLNEKMTMTLHRTAYTIEIGATILLGIISWCLFCVYLKRRARPRP